jgi:hypothetical protein
MPTITVKLEKQRADRLARWARRRKVPKSDVIRALIDRAGLIESGDDLIDPSIPGIASRPFARRLDRGCGGGARGALDEAAALASLQRFTIQGVHLAQARRCALIQRRPPAATGSE